MDAIKLVNITKTFGEVVANKNVNLSIRYGEILSQPRLYIRPRMGASPASMGAQLRRIRAGGFFQSKEGVHGKKGRRQSQRTPFAGQASVNEIQFHLQRLLRHTHLTQLFQ